MDRGLQALGGVNFVAGTDKSTASRPTRVAGPSRLEGSQLGPESALRTRSARVTRYRPPDDDELALGVPIMRADLGRVS